MPQARQILRRIGSVKNTQKITKAMMMVASAKLNRAQQRMLAMRPYAEGIQRSLGVVAVDLVGDEHPLFQPREAKRSLTVAIAGDSGLCGGFNAQIVRFAREHADGLPDRKHGFYAIGKRAYQGLRKTAYPVEKTYFEVFDKLSFVLANEIASTLVERFLSKDEAERIDEAYLVYNRFESVIRQTPTKVKLMPIPFESLAEKHAEAEKAEAESDGTSRPIYEIEPDPSAALQSLLSHHLGTQVFRGVLESYAAELAARRQAMDNATNNAEEMIDSLTLEYNRARQSGITSELLDIIGGANALG